MWTTRNMNLKPPTLYKDKDLEVFIRIIYVRHVIVVNLAKLIEKELKHVVL